MCACVWLTHFPHGPSGNLREWPLQTLPRHPPFPVGGNGGNLTSEISCLFRYTVCATFIVMVIWCHCPVGANTPCSTCSGNPKCYLNKTTMLTYTNWIRQRKQIPGGSSFHWITVLWGCLHSGRIKAFMVQPISPGHLRTWLCEWTWVFMHTCKCVCLCVCVWLEAPAPLKSVPGPYQQSSVSRGDECVWPWLPSSPRPARGKMGEKRGDNLKYQRSIVPVSGMYL